MTMAVLREVYDVAVEDKSYWVVRIALLVIALLVLFLKYHTALGVLFR